MSSPAPGPVPRLGPGGPPPRDGTPAARPRVERRLWAGVLALLAAVTVGLPVLSVLASVFAAPDSGDTLRHLATTIVPRAAFDSAVLALLVAAGVVLIGTATGWLVACADFPGRRVFEWALLLPLAMPAYIVAYAYTDFLQYAGPLQGSLRVAFGWERGDYWFPEIRSVPGAALLFALVFYPYVFLLARTAFMARTAAMVDAARSLGVSRWQAWWRVDLPLARPAIAAGALLAVMETLADYGAVAYFGLQTFTTAIYRAWFSLGDRVAASQLAAVLLVVVLLVLAAERRLRGRARFHAAPASQRPAPRTTLTGAARWAASAACIVPIVLGFALPVVLLVRLLLPSWANVPWERAGEWLRNTLLIGASGAVVTLVVVLLLAYTARAVSRGVPGWMVRVAVRVMALGYAVPGAVVAVGILVPLALADNAFDGWMRANFGIATGLLLTGSVFALLYGYLVRYFAVAWQPVEAGLGRITPAMDACARSLGSGPAEAFLRVHLPLLAPSVLAAALLVFVDVMKELPATLVLRPFDFDTLAVVTYQLAADERLGEAALPALAIVAVGVLPVILLSRAIGRVVR